MVVLSCEPSRPEQMRPQKGFLGPGWEHLLHRAELVLRWVTQSCESANEEETRHGFLLKVEKTQTLQVFGQDKNTTGL